MIIIFWAKFLYILDEERSEPLAYINKSEWDDYSQFDKSNLTRFIADEYLGLEGVEIEPEITENDIKLKNLLNLNNFKVKNWLKNGV